MPPLTMRHDALAIASVHRHNSTHGADLIKQEKMKHMQRAENTDQQQLYEAQSLGCKQGIPVGLRLTDAAVSTEGGSAGAALVPTTQQKLWQTRRQGQQKLCTT